ncbi:MAG: hypothetical protein KF684_06550 [Phycisphaeraceae bacterium]|nr:hypothetical protein [Phycisphaeraceae bacterium]
MRLTTQDLSRATRAVFIASLLAGAGALVGCDDAPDNASEAVDRAADAADDAIDKASDAID